VEDAALLFDAMHGPDPLDPGTLPHARSDVLASLKEGIEGMRFAALPEEELGFVEPAVMSAFNAALEVLRSLGATVTTLSLAGSFAAAADAVGKIIAAEGYEKMQARVDSNEPPMDEDVRARIGSGKSISAVEYIRILAERRRMMRELEARWRGFDALLTPTTPLAAIPVSACDQKQAPMSRLTRPVNLLDLCALAVPCGFTQAGLPVSLQIVGRAYQEARVLRIGWAYESATDWHKRTPQLD
jgi:aspartyl-tRNA(Asn)/glutamyl-tRNA(Gln) amidotransferase subunit A